MTTELRIKRMPLPLVEVPDDETMWGRHDTYAEVSCGGITAEVVRFSYWDERDGRTEVEQTYEVRITGMPDDGGGTCELYSKRAEPLRALAAVAAQAAVLLEELQQSRSEVPA